MLSRMEHDSIGALNVPAEAYYGVQSMRVATNFQITHRPLHLALIDSIVHPNDHVNMSQSTNDVIPTAGKITVLKLLPQTIKELEKLEKAMEEKEAEFDDILKMGRTQLQNAVPMRLGQSFGAFAHVLKRDIKRLKNVMDEMKVLNIGATAIGTAINVAPYYLANISYELSKVAGISLKQADDSSKTEWFIHHARKDQPVIPEVVSQVAYLIIGHDYTITMAAEAGQCEEYIEKSVGISTALCPYIGYAKSAEIAKKSLKTGISVKELVLEEGLLKEEELKEILKSEKMTQPMREKVMKAVS